MKPTQAASVCARRLVLLVVSVIACIASARAAAAAPTKVACIGEHTTHSDLYPTANREQQPPGMQEYPRILQDLMGADYDVRNFGDCCASVVQGYPSSETHPYLSGGNYKNSVAFAPDVVVIGSWGRHDWGLSAKTALPVFTIQKFQADYELLVKAYLALPKVPKIYCSLPIPILAGNDGPDDGYKTSPAADAIKAVAAKYGLPTIDLFSAFLGHPELYRAKPMSDSEGEHVNDAGMQKLAELVHTALTGGVGGADGGVSNGGQGSSMDAGGGLGGSAGSDGAAVGGAIGAIGGSGGDPLSNGGSAVVAASGGPSDTPDAGSSISGSAGGGGSSAPASPGVDSASSGCSVLSGREQRAPWSAVFPLAVGVAVLLRRRRRPAPGASVWSVNRGKGLP